MSLIAIIIIIGRKGIIVEPLKLDRPVNNDAGESRIVHINTHEQPQADWRDISKKINIIAEEDIPENYHTCRGFFVLFLAVVQNGNKVQVS